jgi:MFS family permease
LSDPNTLPGKVLSYLSEFRLNWTNLLGAGLGLAFGSAFYHYMSNLFGPALIAEFGWSKAEYAVMGSLGLLTMFFTPIAGRMTDILGTRKAAMIGFSVIPTAFIALSFMTGELWQFYLILAIKACIGILATTMTFTRVVVERFDRARGFALACLLSCPPLLGAIGAQVIGPIIETEGWRTAYRVMALLSATGGIVAVLLIGKYANADGSARPVPPKLDWAQFREFCRNPVFVLLLAGMFLVNFPQTLVSGQMSIMMMENGATAKYAAGMLSVYGVMVIIGRFIGGFALDRVAPHYVAIAFLGLPAVGFLLLATPLDAKWALALSIGLVGLAQGAETDVASILTSRRFDMGHYSFVLSMLMTSMGVASALGGILLSSLLAMGFNFNPFLVVCAVSTIGGAICFYLTGSMGARHDRLMAAKS